LTGPIFIDVLGKDMKNETWKAHIELLTNFWAAIALGESDYNRTPFAPHLEFADRLSVKAFERWLKLFLKRLTVFMNPH
jgi:hemoglobin